MLGLQLGLSLFSAMYDMIDIDSKCKVEILYVCMSS